MTQKQKKKQVKITQLFRKHGSAKRFEECDELLEEVKELEKRLQEKHDELFQIQRQNCRKKAVPPKAKPKKITQDKTPIIMLSASVETLKRNMELMSMLTGVEVRDYVPQDHCCVVYHVQRGARVEHSHGLRIDMQSDGKKVSNSNLPLGFNLKAVLEQFDNVMQPKCLGSIRRALVAYYDRLEQYEALKKLLIIDADLFKLLDGSYIEISFIVQSHEEEEEEHQVILTLEYRVYDITPMIYSFIENDLPENVLEVLNQQCAVFKKKPLHKAFKRAFMDDIGPYRLVRLLGPRREEQRDKRPKLVRPNKKHYNNDDTFHPEECSDQSEDEHLSE